MAIKRVRMKEPSRLGALYLWALNGGTHREPKAESQEPSVEAESTVDAGGWALEVGPLPRQLAVGDLEIARAAGLTLAM
jgi:hypothetical protein